MQLSEDRAMADFRLRTYVVMLAPVLVRGEGVTTDPAGGSMLVPYRHAVASCAGRIGCGRGSLSHPPERMVS
jgi:hypothetical protein